jgi:hypothetical protein
MIAMGMEISELTGKAVVEVRVYTDGVFIRFDNGTQAAIFNAAEGMRVMLERPATLEGGIPSSRVVPGEFPFPGKLPEGALRRS